MVFRWDKSPFRLKWPRTRCIHKNIVHMLFVYHKQSFFILFTPFFFPLSSIYGEERQLPMAEYIDLFLYGAFALVIPIKSAFMIYIVFADDRWLGSLGHTLIRTHKIKRRFLHWMKLVILSGVFSDHTYENSLSMESMVCVVATSSSIEWLLLFLCLVSTVLMPFTLKMLFSAVFISMRYQFKYISSPHLMICRCSLLSRYIFVRVKTTKPRIAGKKRRVYNISSITYSIAWVDGYVCVCVCANDNCEIDCVEQCRCIWYYKRCHNPRGLFNLECRRARKMNWSTVALIILSHALFLDWI